MSYEDCIDVVQEWVQDQNYLTSAFIDRGDPAIDDFTHLTLTQDGAWHDLDLSAIVPAGATAVLLRLLMINANIDKDIIFRKAGNANAVNVSQCTTQVANQKIAADLVCPIASNRHIEYIITPAGWTLIILSVKGWWL